MSSHDSHATLFPLEPPTDPPPFYPPGMPKGPSLDRRNVVGEGSQIIPHSIPPSSGGTSHRGTFSKSGSASPSLASSRPDRDSWLTRFLIRERPPLEATPDLLTKIQTLGIEAEAREPDGLDDTELWLGGLPAWLGSFVFHLMVLVVIGLLVLPSKEKRAIVFDAIFADRIGDQVDNDLLELTMPDADDVKTPEFSPEPELATDTPFATPPELPITLDRGLLSSEIPAPDMGVAYLGRTEGMKQSLLKAYGGTAETEEAVAKALEWLKRNQTRYGYWSLQGPYADGATLENHAAATAMALLAFQGAGHTHRTGKYKLEVQRGMQALLKMQDKSGSFYHGESRIHRPYTEAMATLALAELYAMTKDEDLRRPAQLAVNHAVKGQGVQGGFRYVPRQDSDTSVTGWYLMALYSARSAGLDVPSEVFERISGYLDLAAASDGARYGYTPNQFETPSMTAEGLLCRQFMGWKPDDRRLLSGAEYILSNPMEWSNRDSYYWYYATQVLFHLGGYPWQEWNRELRELLPKNQERVGKEQGSWSTTGDRWGGPGGRLYVTCLSVYMLEIYYRRMPLYSPVYGDERVEGPGAPNRSAAK